MNIDDVLRELDLSYITTGNHHCRPGWYQFQHCPFCGSVKHHLGLKLKGRYFSCWSCGRHPLIETLAKLTNRDTRYIMSLTRNLELDRRLASDADNGPTAAGKLTYPKHLGPLLEAHVAYLKRRQYRKRDVLPFGAPLYGIGIAPELQWRIVIPITFNGKVVSWTSRSIASNAEVKYISAKPSQEVLLHKNLIYGIDLCHDSILVVEGPMDAWRIGPGAGATFGTAFSLSQVAAIATFRRRTLCYDNEPAAQARANAMADLLAPMPGETNVVQIDAKDPGEADEAEIKQLRKLFL